MFAGHFLCDRFVSDTLQEGDSIPHHDYLAQRRTLDNASTAWAAYVYETFVLIRNFLNRNFGTFVGPSPGTSGDSRNVGGRLIRAVTKLFDADEGAIYRVNYSAGDRKLEVYGSYTDFASPTERSERLHSFMGSICASQERKVSISYRAADTAQTQVCDFFNSITGVSIPSNQPMAFPPEIHNQCGKSGCAVPIVIDGRVWGIVQLISKHPYGFPIEKVKKLEDLSNMISPFFHYQAIFSILAQIYQEIADPNKTFLEKTKRICVLLLDLFMCDSAAVFLRTRSGQLYPQAARFRPDIDNFLRAEADNSIQTVARLQSLEVSALEDIGPEAQIYFMGAPPFDDAFFARCENQYLSTRNGSLIIAIPLAEASLGTAGTPNSATGPTSAFGLITLFLERKGSYEVNQVISASRLLQRYLVVAFQTAFANFVWEGTTRRVLHHEIQRLSVELESRLKVAKRLVDDVNDDDLQFRLNRSMEDLQAHYNDLKHFSDMFRSLPQIEKQDPMVAAAQKIKQEDDQLGILRHAPTDLREMAQTCFKSWKAQSELRGIRIDVQIATRPMVAMNARNLRDVLGNIAENAIKYADESSEISVRLMVDNGKFRLFIENIAPPLSEDDLARVFEDGFRGEYAIKNKIPGMGRGLHYARAIMRLYQGEVRYKLRPRSSAEGPDAEFVVWHSVEVLFPRSISVEG